MKALQRGQFYWTRRGETQRQLALVLFDGPVWVTARVFSVRNKKWGAQALAPRSCFVGAAAPNEYEVRRALQFADLELTNVLLEKAPKAKRQRA